MLARGGLKAHYPFPFAFLLFLSLYPLSFYLLFRLSVSAWDQQTHWEAEEEDIKWLGLVVQPQRQPLLPSHPTDVMLVQAGHSIGSVWPQPLGAGLFESRNTRESSSSKAKQAHGWGLSSRKL